MGKAGKIRNTFNMRVCEKSQGLFFFPGRKYFFKVIPSFTWKGGLVMSGWPRNFTFIKAYIELSHLMFLFSLIFSLKGDQIDIAF